MPEDIKAAKKKIAERLKSFGEVVKKLDQQAGAADVFIDTVDKENK